MDLGPVVEYDSATVSGEREAAVLAGIVERPAGPHILFTKRSEDLEDHPGQMSFPGGGREPFDADLQETALREAREEVGLSPSEATVVGRIDDILTVTDYSIRPFVGRIPDRTYEPGDAEVAEIAVLPVAELINLDNYETECREHPSHGSVRLHYFHVDGYTVWGATARMLVQLLELATDWEPPSGPECQAGPNSPA
ncbi:NUDIX hydrolase [Halorhabdus rudnickae]|uniref:NUDIX hydrolase n=1 Tax=Halorhabdus rudnickae TaxID=1775544 RepID=UPI0010835675|nr:CoA pyrophosphatase [Halorhabdus rudnickae]